MMMMTMAGEMPVMTMDFPVVGGVMMAMIVPRLNITLKV